MFKTINIEVPDYIKQLVNMTDKSFVAGGSVRAMYEKEPVGFDVDMFSQDSNTFKELKAKLEDGGLTKQFENPMLARFVQKDHEDKVLYTVDAVVPRTETFMRTEGKPEDVISCFDFTVARAALISDSMALVDESFEDDIKKRVLVIKNIVCPIGAVKRINKYVKKGYFISLAEIMKLFIEYRNRDMQELEALLSRTNLTEEELARLLQLVYID